MTFSIAACEPATGHIGVAVQSHYLAVGRLAPWADAGVGSVATQAIPAQGQGRAILAALAVGASPTDALAGALANDPGVELRQIIVAAPGGTAGHTGSSCLPAASHVTGQTAIAAANMVASESVPAAMIRAFEAGRTESLADRLLLALQAGQHAGGDLRGQQSAALLVVGAASADPDVVNLRVDDSPEPIAELARLARLAESYQRLEAVVSAVGLFGNGQREDGHPTGELLDELRAAVPTLPANGEGAFWAGASFGLLGDERAAADLLGVACDENPGWLKILDGLVGVGLLAPDVHARIRPSPPASADVAPTGQTIWRATTGGEAVALGQLYDAWFNASAAHDREFFEQTLAENWRYVDMGGNELRKAQYLDQVDSRDFTGAAVMLELQTLDLGAVALAGGTYRVDGALRGKDVSGLIRFTAVWVTTSSPPFWRALAHQANVIP